MKMPGRNVFAEQVMVQVILELTDGGTLQAAWTWGEIQEGVKPPFRQGPPYWVEDPQRVWPHPSKPITFMGRVKPGHEEEARALVEKRQTA
jgi:hypothetical protein